MGEYWDVLDENGEKTGRVVRRGRITKLSGGEYHLTVHIWIVNDKGQVLIQQRANNVYIMPGRWAITSGSVVAGESSRTGAARELYEELGIRAPKQSLKFIFRVKRRNSFCDVWVLRTNVNICDIKMQAEEVQAARWVSIGELREMVEKRKFHVYPYLNELLRLFREEEEKKQRQKGEPHGTK